MLTLQYRMISLYAIHYDCWDSVELSLGHKDHFQISTVIWNNMATNIHHILKCWNTCMSKVSVNTMHWLQMLNYIYIRLIDRGYWKILTGQNGILNQYMREAVKPNKKQYVKLLKVIWPIIDQSALSIYIWHIIKVYIGMYDTVCMLI